MIIFLFISVLFIVSSFYKFKETFCFYLAFKMLAVQAMCIRYAPPALSIMTLLNAYFVFEFIRRGYFKIMVDHFRSFPLRIFFILSFVSMALSGVFSIIPMKTFFLSLVINVLDDFFIPFIFWFCIYQLKEIKFFIKCLIFVFGIACFFGVVEFLLNKNLFHVLLESSVSQDLLEGKLYAPEERLGLRRVTSLFVSPNDFIYGAFVTVLLFVYNIYVKIKINYATYFLFLTITLILMANSRTVLLSSVVLLLPLFISKKNRSLIYIAIGVLILAFPFVEQYLLNFTSIFSSKVSMEGSSLTGRLAQFIGSIELFAKSPIIGNGIDSISYFVSDRGGYKWIILGTESIWMKLMIERGMLGIIAYIVLFIELSFRFKVLKNKYLLFTMMGYLMAHTMSSLPGFSVSFFYIMMFCMYRIMHSEETNLLENNMENNNGIKEKNDVPDNKVQGVMKYK